MKIIMTLLVRDEEDIIRENIDFHLSHGVDFIIATDNKSIDSTPEILKEYQQKGVLHYILETDDNYNQTKWVTRMARMAYDIFDADWVINNDADEFWYSHNSNLKNAFSKIDNKFNVAQISRHNFVPVILENSPFYKKMIYKEKSSKNSLGKPLPPKVAHRGDTNVIVSQGNHSISNIDFILTKPNDLEILHFPIRNHSQISNKIIKGGAAYGRNEALSKIAGSTWIHLYGEYQKEKNLDNYYMNQLFDDKKIERALNDNTINEDLRLLKYFNSLYDY